jgi:hypothetical protein
VWINSSCVASKFPRHAKAPLSEYSPIEADSAEVLALHDGSFEPKLRRPDRCDVAAGPRADDNDQISFSLRHRSRDLVCLPAAGSRLKGPSTYTIKQIDDVPEAVSWDALSDEDNPRPMIAIGPTVEPGHRVEEMLRALDHGWSAWFLGDVYESLDAQKPRSEVLRNSAKQKLNFLTRERALARENEILNSPAFEVETVGMTAVVIVIVMAMIVVTSIILVRSVLMGLEVEPRARVRLRVCRVEASRRK